MFQFVIGVLVGVSVAILLAIFLPDRWVKITKESAEELKR